MLFAHIMNSHSGVHLEFKSTLFACLKKVPEAGLLFYFIALNAFNFYSHFETQWRVLMVCKKKNLTNCYTPPNESHALFIRFRKEDGQINSLHVATVAIVNQYRLLEFLEEILQKSEDEK